MSTVIGGITTTGGNCINKCHDATVCKRRNRLKQTLGFSGLVHFLVAVGDNPTAWHIPFNAFAIIHKIDDWRSSFIRKLGLRLNAYSYNKNGTFTCKHHEAHR